MQGWVDLDVGCIPKQLSNPARSQTHELSILSVTSSIHVHIHSVDIITGIIYDQLHAHNQVTAWYVQQGIWANAHEMHESL